MTKGWYNESHRHSLSARGIPNKITVYHGTDLSSAERILKEGVKPPNKENIKRDLLTEYNIDEKDVPEWVWTKGRYLGYEGREGFSATPSKEMARGYSTHPQEMRNTMEHNLQIFLGLKEGIYGASDLKYDMEPAVIECELENPEKHNWFYPGDTPEPFEDIYEQMNDPDHGSEWCEVEVSKDNLDDIKCKRIVND